MGSLRELFRFKSAAQKTAEELCLNGTAEEFRKATEEAVCHRGLGDLYDAALKAFDIGRPEKMQMILAEFPAVYSAAIDDRQETAYFIDRTVTAIASASADPAVTIGLLLGKTPAADKQKTLNNLLSFSVRYGDSEAFTLEVLKAGAKPCHHDGSDWNAYDFGRTVQAYSDEAVVQLIEAGAEVDRTLEMMKYNHWREEYQQKLRACQARAAAQAATAAVAIEAPVAAAPATAPAADKPAVQ